MNTQYNINTFKSFVLKQQAFSLVEILVAMSIIGILSAIGIRSYDTQKNRAKQSEAKYALSTVYTSEKSFKTIWGTYHENLVLIGAIPDGKYNYNIGFFVAEANMKTISGHPSCPTATPVVCDNFIKDLECSNFKDICNAKTCAAPGSPSPSFTCNVVSAAPSFTPTSPYSSVVVTATTTEKFQAHAIGKLKSIDVWSIDENKDLKNPESGI